MKCRHCKKKESYNDSPFCKDCLIEAGAVFDNFYWECPDCSFSTTSRFEAEEAHECKE